MEKRFYVYIVRHPRNLQPIYVGRGSGKRKCEHIVGRSRNARLEALRQELMPVRLSGEILERFASGQEASAKEMALIKRYGRLENGGTLYNATDGRRRGGKQEAMV